jgi:hypothetical protein
MAVELFGLHVTPPPAGDFRTNTLSDYPLPLPGSLLVAKQRTHPDGCGVMEHLVWATEQRLQSAYTTLGAAVALLMAAY